VTNKTLFNEKAHWILGLTC